MEVKFKGEVQNSGCLPVCPVCQKQIDRFSTVAPLSFVDADLCALTKKQWRDLRRRGGKLVLSAVCLYCGTPSAFAFTEKGFERQEVDSYDSRSTPGPL